MATMSAIRVSRAYAWPESSWTAANIAAVTAIHASTVSQREMWITRISDLPIVSSRVLSEAKDPPRMHPGGSFATLRTSDYGIRLALLSPRMGNLLWIIIVVLVILWLGGFAMNIGGSLI